MSKKKLRLRRETLRHLDAVALARVAGRAYAATAAVCTSEPSAEINCQSHDPNGCRTTLVAR